MDESFTETLTIHFLIRKGDRTWYVGEDITGKGDSFVYIENPNYKKEILYKVKNKKYVFKDRNAFIQTGVWAS